MNEAVPKSNFKSTKGMRILSIIFLWLRDDLSQPFITLANKSERQMDVTVPTP